MHKIMEFAGKAKKGFAGFLEGKGLKRHCLASAKFLAVFFVFFAGLFVFFSFLPAHFFEYAAALPAGFLLELFGHSVEIVREEHVIIFLNARHEIVISELCTGFLESIVILSAMAASLGIKIKKRVFGAVAGLFFLALLNSLRISLTGHAIATIRDVALVEFIHDFLFRVVLFLGIAVFYAAWYYWAIGREKQSQQ